MPSLASMFQLCHQKSFYSRQDAEVYAALEEAGFAVYSAVLKEFRGTFLKVDTTTVTLTPGQQEYTLPADLTNILSIAECQSSSENWHRMSPEGLTDAIDNVQQNLSYFDYGMNFGEESQFMFYGPYLDAADADNPTSATQIQKIRVSPNPTESRFVQIAYAAKWLPLTGANSPLMLPIEGTYAMQNYAVAELLRANNDTNSREYELKGDKHLTSFLSWLRTNQSMQRPHVTPYLS